MRGLIFQGRAVDLPVIVVAATGLTANTAMATWIRRAARFGFSRRWRSGPT